MSTWELMLQRRYAAALEELNRQIARPDQEELSPLDWELRARLGFCLLGLRRETEALTVFEILLHEGRPQDRRLIAAFIRNHLGGRGIGPGWPRTGLASEQMTEFVWELSAFLRGRRGTRCPPRTSYGKLRRRLWKTYPPYAYDHVDLTGCDRAEAARRLCEEALRQARAAPPRTALPAWRSQ